MRIVARLSNETHFGPNSRVRRVSDCNLSSEVDNVDCNKGACKEQLNSIPSGSDHDVTHHKTMNRLTKNVSRVTRREERRQLEQ